MSPELLEAHEVLIAEHEALEARFEQLAAAKKREARKFRDEIDVLRGQLEGALREVDELQQLLSRSWLTTREELA